MNNGTFPLLVRFFFGHFLTGILSSFLDLISSDPSRSGSFKKGNIQGYNIKTTAAPIKVGNSSFHPSPEFYVSQSLISLCFFFNRINNNNHVAVVFGYGFTFITTRTKHHRPSSDSKSINTS